MLNLIDWEKDGPKVITNQFFSEVQDEATFPHSYSGDAWRVAFRFYHKALENEKYYDSLNIFSMADTLDFSDLTITLFQLGWAWNTSRQLRGKEVGINPGCLVVRGDTIEAPVIQSVYSAEVDLEVMLGKAHSVINIDCEETSRERQLSVKHHSDKEGIGQWLL